MSTNYIMHIIGQVHCSSGLHESSNLLKYHSLVVNSFDMYLLTGTRERPYMY